MRRKTRYSDNGSLGFMERMLLPAIQSVTDGVLPHPRGREGPRRHYISLGTHRDPFNRKRREEQRLPVAALLRHLYAAGATGSGKTMALFIMVKELILHRVGFSVNDLQGDLSRMILSYLVELSEDPAWAQLIRERLVMVDPFHPTYALAYNPLDAPTPQRIYQVVADLMERLRNQWSESWGPRLDEILRNTLLSLALQHRPFADIPRFLTDADFRREVVASLDDPMLKAFWQTRFEPLSEAAKLAAIQPVLNKIAPMIDDFYLRHSFAQARSRLHFRPALDQSKIILINAAKGIAGANAGAIAAMMMSAIWTAVISRIDIPEVERVPSILFADEFQNFLRADAPFADILSEARKWGLGLALAHQNLGQLDRQVREAIFGNVASMYFFRLGLKDAPFVADAFADQYRPLVRQELLKLRVGQAITRTPDGGFRVLAVHHVTKPVASDEAIARILQPSFDRYYRPRAEVNQELLRRYAPEVTDITRGRLRPAARTERQALARANPPLPEGEL